MRVKLTSIIGDHEKFADWIGRIGPLDIEIDPTEGAVSMFFPEDRNEALSMRISKLSIHDSDIKLRTVNSNEFTFKIQ